MDNNPIDISIVVPVYNSAQTIAELVKRVQQAMEQVGLTYELILTNDCSTDNSWQVILESCQLHNQVFGLRLAKNCGQWCSSLAGMSMASGKYIVTIDDDLEYDPNDIAKLYKATNPEKLMVVFGIAENKYALQKRNVLLSKIRNRLINILWNKPFTDSFRIIDRRLVFNGNDFLVKMPFEVFMTNKLDKKHLGYCEVRFNKRHSGKSNYPFSKKIRLFLLYSSYYIVNPIQRVALFLALFVLLATISWLLVTNGEVNSFILIMVGLMLCLTGTFVLYYVVSMLSRPKQTAGFLIAEVVGNTRLHSEAGE